MYNEIREMIGATLTNIIMFNNRNFMCHYQVPVCGYGFLVLQ